MRAMAISALFGWIVSSVYFAFHEPGALEVQMTREYEWTPEEHGLLFTAYSIPPCWMTSVAGVMITYYGLKRVGLCLLSFLVTGVLVGAVASSLALSSEARLFWWFIGRLLVGVGGEAMVTWQQAACSQWFSGEHIGKSMSTALAVQQVVGSALSFMVLPAFGTVQGGAWACVVFCTFCLMCLGVYVLVEKSHQPYLRAKRMATRRTSWADTNIWTMMKTFPLTFWAQLLVIFFADTVLYTAANYFPAWLEEVYHMGDEEAGLCTSIMYWMGVFAPLAGMLTDKYGLRLTAQVVTTLTIGVVFLALYLAPPGLLSPYLAIGAVGLLFSVVEYNSYTVLEATWRNVKGEPEGIGFGLLGFALNTGLATLPELVGAIAMRTGTTAHQTAVFACWMFGACAVSAAMRCMPDGDGLDSVGAPAAEQLADDRCERLLPGDK